MRIFFGATLPENAKTQIEQMQRKVRTLSHEARIEARSKLHITLQFIGDFNPQKIDNLISLVRKEMERQRFKSTITEMVGMNYFPNEKVRRGIWIDCRDDGTLAATAELIKSITRQFGVVPEKRPFKPHITIARFHGEGENAANSSSDLQKLWSNGKLSIERFFPESIALFQSTLKSSGSEYEILSDIPLIRG